MALPQGFVLDQQAKLPSGFVLDPPVVPQQELKITSDPYGYTPEMYPQRPPLGPSTKDYLQGLTQPGPVMAEHMQPGVGKALAEQGTLGNVVMAPMLPGLLGAKFIGPVLRSLFAIKGAETAGQALGTLQGTQDPGQRHYLETQAILGGTMAAGAPRVPEALAGVFQAGHDLGFANADKFVPEFQKPQPQRELSLEERNARVNWLRSQQPQQKPSVAVAPPQAATPINPGGPSENLPPVLAAIEAANKAKQMQIAQEFKAQLAQKQKEQNAIQSSNAQLYGGVRPRNEAEQVGAKVPVSQQSQAVSVGGSQVQGLATQEKVQSAPQEKVSGAVGGALQRGVGSYGQSGREVSTEVKGTSNLSAQAGSSKKIKTETMLQQLGINPTAGGRPFARLTRGQLQEKWRAVSEVLRNQMIQNHPDRFPFSGPEVQRAQGAKFAQLQAVRNELQKRFAYKIANTPEIGGGTTVQGKSSVPKVDKTSGESGFVIAPKEMWDRVFSNKGTKADPEQMWNRLRNVFGEGSATWKALQDMGLRSFLSSPKSTSEVEQWANQNMSKVEVRKFGEKATKTPEEIKNDEIVHRLDTILGGGQGEQIIQRGEGEIIPYITDLARVRQNPQLGEQVLSLYRQYNQNLYRGQEGSRSHWQSIAPKSEQDMPGYVEIAVVKPQKQVTKVMGNTPPKQGYSNTGMYTETENPQFPSTHSFPPNTLGFVRGYMETLPNGEKVFHVIEVQSDWAQSVRANQDYLAGRGEFPTAYERAKGMNNDPLLPHYERLALKAAIDHARSEGATKIAISDAETAMMTEGHDQTGAMLEATPENVALAKKLQPETIGLSKGDGFRMAVESMLKGEDFLATLHEQDLEESGFKVSREKPSQEPGMRLHYDRTLPKIAEELTGSKGEKVSFGEHRMAFDKGYDTSTTEDIPTQVPRKDLIFRNEQGQPKTDVSARMFSLKEKQLPQEFSLYGKSGALFPESPAAKAAKASGAKEELPDIVQHAKDKLDSLKSFGGDILNAVTDSNAFKAWVLKRQGYDLPKIEAINPDFANVVAKYANSQVASTLRAHANITKVLGNKLDNEQFRKQLGGLIYEDMRRASGNIGNPVFKLKNSPFANEAQYQAALKNPEMQQALSRWKQFIQPLATEMHEKLGGGLAESGQQTGAFANLIAVLSSDRTELEQMANAPSTVGPLATMKRGSAFSKERKFTGEEYNLDASDMAFRMLTKNAQQAALRDVYSAGEKAGLLKLLKPGDETPAGMVRQQNPVTLRSIVTKDAQGNTESANVSRWLAFDKRISPTLKQALQLNTSWKEALKEGAPALHVASQAIIKTQVGLGIDLGFHTFNDMMAVANSPKGLLALPKKTLETAKAWQDLASNNPAVQEELAKAAEAGVTFRGESLGGWSSHALKVADTVTRLVLNREYDTLVKQGMIKDLPTERRRYINGRAGQYNKRFMTWFQQGMQETGLGSFNVAGRNFNRLAVGNLTFSPGVKASSNVDALRLRLSIAAGIATAAIVVPSAVNTALWGTPQPAGTTLGDIAIHKNKDGRYEVINMRKWTMLARGGRASGLGAVMNEQIMPRLQGEQPASLGQTASDAAKDIGRTAVAPFSGPPLNLLSVGLTGRTEGGLGYEQRTPGEKPPYLQAMLGQLNPLVGPLVQSGQGATAGGRVAQRIGSIVGVQASQAPFSVIRNRATQWKVRNNIHTDDQSFAPSQYLPMKQALLINDIATAKQEYQQLISDKAQQHPSLSDDEAKHEAMMDLQREFSKLENFRFVNKENEDRFKASLSTEQRKMYDLAVQQQKEIADKFFTEIQGKIDNKKPTGFRPPTFRRARGFSQQFAQ